MLGGCSTSEQPGDIELADKSAATTSQDTTPLPLGPLLMRALVEIRWAEKDSVEPNEVSTPLLDAKVGLLTTPERRSRRRAASVDSDSIERAAKLVAKHNLEEQHGNTTKHSFLSFDDKRVANNVGSIGISTGIEDKAIHSSVHLIKDM